MNDLNRWLRASAFALAGALLLASAASAQPSYYTVSPLNLQLKLSFQDFDQDRERYEIRDLNLGTKTAINLLLHRNPDETVPKHEILALFMECNPYMPYQYYVGVWDREFNETLSEPIPFKIKHSVFEQDKRGVAKKTEISSFFKLRGLENPKASSAGPQAPCVGIGCECVGGSCNGDGPGTVIAVSAKIEWGELPKKLRDEFLNTDSVGDDEEVMSCLKQFKTNSMAGHIDFGILSNGNITAQGNGDSGDAATIRGGNFSAGKPIALYSPDIIK